jgi:hypothetical protein
MFCAAQTACIFRDHTIIGLRYRYIVGLYKYLLNVERLNSKTNCDLQITVCFYFCVRSIWAPFVAGRTSNLQFNVFHVCSDVVVKSKACIHRYRHAGAKGEKRYSSYSLLTSVLDGWVVSVTPWPRFTPGERTPGTHSIGSLVGLRADLDTKARGNALCLCWRSKPGRTVCSQTLYGLSYPIFH